MLTTGLEKKKLTWLEGHCGVFATREFKIYDILLQFSGPPLTREEVAKINQDMVLEIGPDLYIGSSGEIDDFVNHSCSPNAVVQIEDNKAYFVPTRTIKAGEEITFDYSSTSTDWPEDWHISCKCGSKKCRKIISGLAHSKCLTPRI